MIVLVCGRIKEGKTTLALHLAREWSQGVIVWDPRHMIEGGSYVSDAEELEDAIQEKHWRNGPIIFRPDGLQLEEDFNSLCNVLFSPPERFAPGGFALVVDEAGDLQSAHRIERHLARAVKQHPRSALIIQTTHSLQDWHRNSRDLTSAVYSFRLMGRSLHALVEFCDGSEELEDAIKNLPRHHCVKIDFEAENGKPEFEYMGSSWFRGETRREVHSAEEAGYTSESQTIQ